MNIKKLATVTAVAAVLVTGSTFGASFVQADASHHAPNQPQEVELRVVNDINNSNAIEYILESRGDWPAEENCVVGNIVTQGQTRTIYYMEGPGQINELLSFRYQGTLYQLELNEFLDRSKTVKLSDFVPQENDYYQYR